jgi:hypothetical protein
MSTVKQYRNLARVYDEGFVSSRDRQKRDEAVLLDILGADSRPGRKIQREYLERCLEIADRHGLLKENEPHKKNGLVRRMQSSLINLRTVESELAAAMYFEQEGNRVAFYPPGDRNKMLEFSVKPRKGARILAEVKTLFPEKAEHRHDVCMFFVKGCLERCCLPFTIGVKRLSPNTNFSRRKLADFLKRELGKALQEAEPKARDVFRLPEYREANGFGVEMVAFFNPEAAFTQCEWSIRTPSIEEFSRRSEHEEREAIQNALHGAYRQLPKNSSGNLVIIDVTNRFWLIKHEVVAALYGEDSMDADSGHQQNTKDGDGSGFWSANRNSKVGAVMVIRRLVNRPTQPIVRVFHNPWARRGAIGRLLFPRGPKPVCTRLFGDKAIHYTFDVKNRTVGVSRPDTDEWW